jgi:hypothetical protein
VSIACLVHFHFDNASFGIGPVKILSEDSGVSNAMFSEGSVSVRWTSNTAIFHSIPIGLHLAPTECLRKCRSFHRTAHKNASLDSIGINCLKSLERLHTFLLHRDILVVCAALTIVIRHGASLLVHI